MKPFIVAELSASHLGSLQRALDIVDAAAAAGADAIKLQTWDRASMVLDREFLIAAGTWAGRKLWELYEEAWTPWDWHKEIFEFAGSLGMEAFSTPFDHKALAFLEELKCPRYKVSSFEITDLPLIRAIAQTGKPMIISTGMATEDEIDRAVAAALGECANAVTLLKCTSAYPAHADNANLATMHSMAGKWCCHPGLSDHTPGIGVAVAAAALGATVIEKHLTLRRSDGGPDAAFSMEPDEFKAMVTACRQAAAALGTVRYGPTEAELPQLELRRSIQFASELPAGHIVTANDLMTARPATGLPPSRWDSLIGLKLPRAVQRGDSTCILDNAPRGT